MDKENQELAFAIAAVVVALFIIGALAFATSIIFWLVWTVCGIGASFSFLPASLQAPGLFTTIGIFICLHLLAAPFSCRIGGKGD